MKLLLGSLLAGLALFFYSFISWGVLKWHHPKSFKSDAALAEALKAAAPEPGVYQLPAMQNPDGTHRSEEEVMKASDAGPFLLGVVRPGAATRGMGSYFAGSIAGYLAMALVLGLILMRVSRGYACLVKMSATIGLFTGLASWLPLWNWYGYPPGYWLPYCVDYILQGIIAGAILGKFVGQKGATCAVPAA